MEMEVLSCGADSAKTSKLKKKITLLKIDVSLLSGYGLMRPQMYSFLL